MPTSTAMIISSNNIDVVRYEHISAETFISVSLGRHADLLRRILLRNNFPFIERFVVIDSEHANVFFIYSSQSDVVSAIERWVPGFSQCLYID